MNFITSVDFIFLFCAFLQSPDSQRKNDLHRQTPQWALKVFNQLRSAEAAVSRTEDVLLYNTLFNERLVLQAQRCEDLFYVFKIKCNFVMSYIASFVYFLSRLCIHQCQLLVSMSNLGLL